MSVLQLTDAKRHLGIDDDSRNAQVQDAIDVAESWLVTKIGPLTSQSVTDRVNVSGDTMILPQTPVASITSITAVVVGSAYAPSDVLIDDGPRGVVQLVSGLTFTPGLYSVTYQVGFDPPPAVVLYAIKEKVRELWRSQRGPSSRSGQGGQAPITDFDDLLADYIDPAGFA